MKMIKIEYPDCESTYVNPKIIAVIHEEYEPTTDFPYKIRIVNVKGYELAVTAFTSLEERQEEMNDLLKQLEEV